jgi:hypothetical protein
MNKRRTMRFALFLLHEGSSGMRLALEIPTGHFDASEMR